MGFLGGDFSTESGEYRSDYILLVIVMTFLVHIIGTDLTFSNFFKTFILHLGLITTPHVCYVHMTYVYSFSHVFIFTRSLVQKTISNYDLFYFWSTTNSKTHLHPRFLLSPPQSHHPYTPRLCRSTTAPPAEGYHQGERYGHPEDPDYT